MLVYFKNLLRSNSNVENLNQKNQQKVMTLKKKMNLKRNTAEKLADFLTEIFGSVGFLTINFLWFLIWILINTNLIPGVEAFDPFPFGLLTMIVSLEAIFLAIIVLVSQNRAAKIAELREEVGLQINVQAEGEITRMLNMLDEIHAHLGLAQETDEELVRMKQMTNLDELEDELNKEM